MNFSSDFDLSNLITPDRHLRSSNAIAIEAMSLLGLLLPSADDDDSPEKSFCLVCPPFLE